MSRWLAALLLGIAVAPARADVGAALAECRAAGAARDKLVLERDCPALAFELAVLEQDGLLAGRPTRQISRDELDRLKHLLVPRPGHARRFDHGGLAGILSQSHIKQPPPPSSWWQEFLAWFKQLLPEETERDFSALRDWLARLMPPKWLAERLYQGTLFLIIGLALWVIVNELRQGGWGGWRPRLARLARRGAAIEGRSGPDKLPDLAALKCLPTAQALRFLLPYLVERLTKAGRLQHAPSATPRELARVLQAGADPAAESFALLVNDVEPVIYGGQALSADTQERLWRHAEATVAAT